MKTVILDRSDFVNDGTMGMSFDALLETLEIETSKMVDGRIVPIEVDRIRILVSEAKTEE